MRRRSILAVAAMMLAPWTGAAELTLFDLELRNVTPATLHQAALAAGARPISSSRGHRVYDATRIGLPGARRLETLFDGEQFVVAAYTFDSNSRSDQELRRLLVARYGPPYALLNGRRYTPDITTRYAEVPEARWDVEVPLELIYTQLARSTRSITGVEPRLTYVNRGVFDELERRTREEGQQRDRARAKQLRGAF